MRWSGEGAELWRVRVELFAADENRHRVISASENLRRLLTVADERGVVEDDIGTDQGTGIAGRPVVGFLFWVRADDVGAAAKTAVETARLAGRSSGAGPELYDVTVVPSAAVALPNDPTYPPMPD